MNRNMQAVIDYVKYHSLGSWSQHEWVLNKNTGCTDKFNKNRDDQRTFAFCIAAIAALYDRNVIVVGAEITFKDNKKMYIGDYASKRLNLSKVAFLMENYKGEVLEAFNLAVDDPVNNFEKFIEELYKEYGE